ncbi:hypothetical protein HMPREF1589_02929 [Escherichia coli 113290]|nr:hypothetical protein HMPREF1589_02929 [Escherichia coli 113290]
MPQYPIVKEPYRHGVRCHRADNDTAVSEGMMLRRSAHGDD